MKLKIFIIHLILSVIFFTNNSFSKTLPPGSGIADVPSNVLILLDKSGSMGARMISGGGMMYNYDNTTDGSGNFYTMSRYWWGIKKHSYANGATDLSFGSNGTYIGSGNCRIYYPMAISHNNGYLYVASYYTRRIFRIRISDSVCDWNVSVSYPRSISIRNNIMYTTNAYGLSNTYDLSTATPTRKSCSTFSRDYIRHTRSNTVDRDNSFFYSIYSNRIYRYPIDSNGCVINTNGTARYIRNYIHRIYWNTSIDTHPTDSDILFWSGARNNMITYNWGTNSFSTAGTFGRGASTNSRIQLYYVQGLHVDYANNRIYLSQFYKHGTTILNLDGSFDKEFAASNRTRMTGAHEAIKAIVTDSSLTAGVNFGFGYWSYSRRAGFRGWSGDITTGRPTPCTYSDCLQVRVHKGGAARINSIVSRVNPGGGTYAVDFANMASQYYNHSTLSPIDSSAPCQNSYVIVIGDGQWSGHSTAARTIRNLKNKGIKTFTVAYGGGISGSGLNNFRNMAREGGTNDVIIANTTASLKTQLKAAISQIIASRLSFTAPAISATVTSGGSFFQAQFDYQQNKEWKGTIKRLAISGAGILDANDSNNWSASEMLASPDSRKIWTELPGVDYTTDYNNFVEGNFRQIDSLFNLTNNEVPNYHSVSDTPINTRRCSSAAGVANGNEDDIKGLINFIRGEDYFDYDGDCNLTEERRLDGKKIYMGDIYHSEMVVVGAPSAETAFVSQNQEAYFRSIKGYDAWAASKSSREETIYVGANDGMLHAIDTSDGTERWAFVPPLLAPSLPNIVNVNLNKSTGVRGGSNAIYGVDGSPVVHDMYFRSPLDTAKAWHTILMVPYGRGGAGFSVLDVTDPDAPLHLYSVLNDGIQHQVHVMDHNGRITSHNYIATAYSMASLIEAIEVTDAEEAGESNNVCGTYSGSTVDRTCYQSRTWTLPQSLSGITRSDVTVQFNDRDYTNFSIGVHPTGHAKAGQSFIKFGTAMTYYGHNPCAGVAGTCTLASSNVGIYIRPGSALTGVINAPEYDYSQLGETWSSPRIMRLPNNGAGDSNVEDDIYVAVMGGGFGAQHSGFGSNLTIVNLEDINDPGKIEKVIQIDDLANNGIVNSTPGSPVVITPDTTRGITFSGALVYLNDLEGKVTKFNLTNMDNDGDGNSIALYDKTTLFNSNSTSQNARYMYHSMDATIGTTTNGLWLFSGTGDYERIADKTSTTQNLMLGIRDKDFPLYKIAPQARPHHLVQCANTSNDTTGQPCLVGERQLGWYVILPNFQKVTAEPTVHSGLVYFPIYQPNSSVNPCSLGDAFICAVDDECGSNFSSQLGTFRSNRDKCFYVGQGVLSRIVTFSNKLFANIAGQSTQSLRDLVTLDTGIGGVSSYRSSWRQNY